MTNGKIVWLFVDDESFDVCYGILYWYVCIFDLWVGMLRWEVEWILLVDKMVWVMMIRLVSLTYRLVFVICYEVELVGVLVWVVV